MAKSLKVDENIGMLFEKFQELIKSKTVMGEPVEIGDTTLVPLIDIFLVLGLKGGDGSGKEMIGSAGFSGRVVPTAIIVIKGDDIQLMPVKNNSDLEELLDLVPDIVDNIQCKKKPDSNDGQI